MTQTAKADTACTPDGGVSRGQDRHLDLAINLVRAGLVTDLSACFGTGHLDRNPR